MVIWLRNVLLELGMDQKDPTTTHEENFACLGLSQGKGTFLPANNIGIRYHYRQERIEAKPITLKYIPTENKIAEILTKPIPTTKFYELIEYLVRNLEQNKYIKASSKLHKKFYKN